MRKFKKIKILGFTFFLSIIFALHILNLDNLKTTNSVKELISGESPSSVLIDGSQKIDILSNNEGGFFVLSTDNSSTKISFLDKNWIESNNDVISTKINYKYLDAKGVNNDLYLLIFSEEIGKQVIKISFSEDKFSDEPEKICFLQNNSSVNSIYVADNNLFFVENGELLGFNMNDGSEFVNLLSGVNSVFLSYACDYLYAVKEDNSVCFCSIDALKSSIEEGNLQNFTNLTLNGEINLSNNPVKFLSKNLYMTFTGKLLKINTIQGVPNEISNVFTLDVSDISFLNCSSIFKVDNKDYLFCKTKENKATFFDIENSFYGKYVIDLNENETILNICSSLDDSILVYKTSDNKYFAKLVDKNDLEETDPNIISPDDPGNNQNPNENESDKLLGDYTTDSENKYILGVELGTTIAEFKKNLNLNGEYTVSFKNYTGKEITSGKLGTGSVVTFFKNGNRVKEYTLVVKYDVTGEGNFNSRDLEYMYNEIFKNGKTTLTGEYFLSGNIENDGQIDTLDLLKMRKELDKN